MDSSTEEASFALSSGLILRLKQQEVVCRERFLHDFYVEKCSLNPYHALSCWTETYCHFHLWLEAPDGSSTWHLDKHLSHAASLVSIMLCDESDMGCSCYKAASKEVLFLFPDMSDLIKYMWHHFASVGAHRFARQRAQRCSQVGEGKGRDKQSIC